MPGEKDAESRRRRVPGAPDHGWPRRSRRFTIPGILVAIDAPDLSDQPWVADAIDVSAYGLGLVLPPEIVPGTKVLLSFKLAEGLEFARLPATIQHREGTSGGVRFDDWPATERLKLLEYLVRYYEREC